MKKVCILSAVNIKHMSLVSLYTDELIRKNIDFDIIYMDKYGVEEEFPAKHKYVFVNKIDPSLPSVVRGAKYFRFVRYAKRILEENSYDFIIVWNDVAIFLFGTYLAKRWKGKYCLNIRDYFNQKIGAVYRIFEKAIDGALFTTISSPGYEAFLPKREYIYLNSLNLGILEQCERRTCLRTADEKIRIAFVGNVRFFGINKRLLDIFKNDDRFELHYYGVHSDVLKDYARENGITNAFFGESFPVRDTPHYIDKIDIINNLYGHGTPNVDLSLSIRLYYGLYCNLPILVESGTYMEKTVKDLGNGYVVDALDDDLNDRVYTWYRSIDFETMKRNCENEIERIRSMNEQFIRKLDQYIIGS